MPASTRLRSSRRTTIPTPSYSVDLKNASSIVSSRTCTPESVTSAEDEMRERMVPKMPDSALDQKVTPTIRNGNEDDEHIEEAEVYGLDGDMISRIPGSTDGSRRKNSATASRSDERLKDPGDRAGLDEAGGDGIERDGARGIPVAIPPPSLNLLKTFKDQIGSLGMPFGNGSKNPLGSLEKWGRSWFNGREYSVSNSRPRPMEREDEDEEEANDTDGVDGYALVKDRKGTAGSPSKESINGSSSARDVSNGDQTASATACRRSEMMQFDIGDGRGSRPWLFEFHPSETTALRIWDCGTVGEAGLGGLADIKESLVWDSGPKEVVCFQAVKDEWILDAMLDAKRGQDNAWLFRLVLSAVGDRGIGNIRVEIVDLASGRVTIKRDCGSARSGRLSVSGKFLVVATGADIPSLSIYSKDMLRPCCRAIKDDLGVNTRSGLPVFALQGRLLSYVTSEPAKSSPGRYARMEEFKYGTIVTKQSVKAAADWQDRQREEKLASSPPSESRFSPESLPSMQAMVLNTAAGLSSEVAKGVWSGLKGLGRAAIDGASRSETLSKSAPVVSDLAKRFAGESASRDQTQPGSQRSLSGHAGVKDPLAMPNVSPEKRYEGSSWIKIVDLGQLIPSRRVTGSREESDQYRPSLMVHFAIPILENVSLPRHDLAAVDLLSFSHNGTHLAAANADGRTVAVLELRLVSPIPAADANRPTGQVWLRHDLRRGVTPARIVQISWNRTGSMISVASRKTIHVFNIGIEADSSRPADSGNNTHGLSVKTNADLKIRTSEWLEPDPTVQVRRYSTGDLTLCFLSAVSDKTVQAESSVVLYDSCQRLLGKVSMFKLAKRPSEQREELLPVTMALWQVPEQVASGPVKHKFERDDRIDEQPGRSRHPFSQVEVATFSTAGVPSSIYKDRMFTFFATTSAKFDTLHPVQYRKQVEVSGDLDPQQSIQSALAHDLDPSQAPPMIPALPNGLNGHGKPHWRVQPISVMASKVKGHRQRPKYASIGKPNSYSDTQGQDSGSGFLVDVRDDEDASPPLSLEESQESWEDDLIAGVMDV